MAVRRRNSARGKVGSTRLRTSKDGNRSTDPTEEWSSQVGVRRGIAFEGRRQRIVTAAARGASEKGDGPVSSGDISLRPIKPNKPAVAKVGKKSASAAAFAKVAAAYRNKMSALDNTVAVTQKRKDGSAVLTKRNPSRKRRNDEAAVTTGSESITAAVMTTLSSSSSRKSKQKLSAKYSSTNDVSMNGDKSCFLASRHSHDPLSPMINGKRGTRSVHQQQKHSKLQTSQLKSHNLEDQVDLSCGTISTATTGESQQEDSSFPSTASLSALQQVSRNPAVNITEATTKNVHKKRRATDNAAENAFNSKGADTGADASSLWEEIHGTFVKRPRLKKCKDEKCARSTSAKESWQHENHGHYRSVDNVSTLVEKEMEKKLNVPIQLQQSHGSGAEKRNPSNRFKMDKESDYEGAEKQDGSPFSKASWSLDAPVPQNPISLLLRSPCQTLEQTPIALVHKFNAEVSRQNTTKSLDSVLANSSTKQEKTPVNKLPTKDVCRGKSQKKAQLIGHGITLSTETKSNGFDHDTTHLTRQSFKLSPMGTRKLNPHSNRMDTPTSADTFDSWEDDWNTSSVDDFDEEDKRDCCISCDETPTAEEKGPQTAIECVVAIRGASVINDSNANNEDSDSAFFTSEGFGERNGRKLTKMCREMSTFALQSNIHMRAWRWVLVIALLSIIGGGRHGDTGIPKYPSPSTITRQKRNFLPPPFRLTNTKPKTFGLKSITS